MAPQDVDGYQLTLGRACEIEDGVGKPPTEDELAQLEEFRARTAPILAKTAPALGRQFEGIKAACQVAATAMRKALEGVDMQAVDRVGEHMERDDRIRERYGSTKLHDAPTVLRLIEGTMRPRPPAIGICRPSVRTRAPRPGTRRSRQAATRGSPSSESDEPAPPLGRPRLADDLEAFILEHGPLSASALARELGRRKKSVLRDLNGDPRFRRRGKGRSSKWILSAWGFDVAEAAKHWDCPPKMALELIVGENGFVDRGWVQSLNGGGEPFAVTETGLDVSRAFASIRIA